ncbi:MAG TPA: serine/threonine-protein kinase [Polyangiaceae bacterium]|nr:serine/threonine-protein kinase [Polyangiaceae bacterium]
MDAPEAARIGEVLAGKYRIERVLGQGGMGVVVAATHLQLDERVALKFLLPEALANPEIVARFAREARAAVKIKSEHVARVTDVGTLETGSPYMVMEYLHGSDLGGLVHERGQLPIEDAVDFILQASEAIAEAHALGIIHRDLKPANLFHTRRADGSACIKVLDFGISKVTGLANSGSDLSMTRTSTVMGSPLYMSPEQMASSRDVDVRTDIWALGVILYELLAGQVPFVADTMPQLCAMILQQPPPPLRNRRPDAPEGLQNVISRCLEKDPARRYANMGAFAGALLPYASRSGRTSVERVTRLINSASGGNASPPLETEAFDSIRPGGATQSAWGQGTQQGKGRAPWVVLGFTVLAIGAGATLLLTRKVASTPAAEPVPAAAAPSEAAAALPVAPAAPKAEPTSAPVVAPAGAVSAMPATKPNVAALAARPAAKPAIVSPKPKKPEPNRPQAETPAAAPAKRSAADLYSDRK